MKRERGVGGGEETRERERQRHTERDREGERLTRERGVGEWLERRENPNNYSPKYTGLAQRAHTFLLMVYTACFRLLPSAGTDHQPPITTGVAGCCHTGTRAKIDGTVNLGPTPLKPSHSYTVRSTHVLGSD